MTFTPTKEMTTAYHLLNNSSGGKINIQAHPGSGKTTWITNGVTNSFFKVKNSMGIAFLTQQTKSNSTRNNFQRQRYRFF